eukprot:6001917-Amphidinium_carterae.1
MTLSTMTPTIGASSSCSWTTPWRCYADQTLTVILTLASSHSYGWLWGSLYRYIRHSSASV